MVGVVDAQSKPRVLELLQKSLTVTIHDTKYVCGELQPPCFVCVSVRNDVACRWIPGTAKFVALGEYARNTGCLQVRHTGEYVSMIAVQEVHGIHSSCLQVFELQDNKLQKVQEVEKPARFKCGTFGASSMSERQLATGSFQGQLQVCSLRDQALEWHSRCRLLQVIQDCHLCRVQMWDLEHTKEPVYSAKAHASIINQIDGTGGQASFLAVSTLMICCCIVAG